MKNFSPRARTILIAATALLALVLLAATLNTLRLSPGSEVGLSEMAPPMASGGGSIGLEAFMRSLLRVLMIIAWLCVPLAVVLLIISKDARRRFLRDMLAFLPFFLLLYFLSRKKNGQGVVQEINPRMMDLSTLQTAAPGPSQPMPVYNPPADWITSAISIGLAVVIAAVILSAAWVFYRRSQRRASPLRRIEEEAAAAIEAIEAGGDLSEVIMRCYFQMMDALKQYRNISRERDMTPHEFESYLALRGLPRPPVQQLTRLFEQVRYGDQRVGRAEERAAIESLRAIIRAIQLERGEDGAAGEGALP